MDTMAITDTAHHHQLQHRQACHAIKHGQIGSRWSSCCGELTDTTPGSLDAIIVFGLGMDVILP